MDVIMVLVLFGCFGAVKLFTDWCEKQVGGTRAEQEEEQ